MKLATLALGALAFAPVLAAQQPQAPVRVTAALVLPDLSVRPLPLLQLELVDVADTTRRVPFRTALDGTAEPSVAPGRYRIRTTVPATLADSVFAWDVALEVQPAGAKVELTQANATARRVAAADRPAGGGMPGRQVAPEREVYERVRRGVFRVEAGLGHGSGFLADAHGGVVVTNDHVIGTASSVSVYLDSVTRVPAQVVVRDAEADLAVLRIPAGRCGDCPRLPLAAPREGEPLVVAGERLLAIGFPLSQEMTLTSGIASSVRSGAIISDVNINPGNSGGPMLNLAGEVVAVNTFGESSGRVGAGVSGSVAVGRLRPLLDRVPAALAALPPLEDRALPAMPRTSYATATLKAIADTATVKEYRWMANRLANKFMVSLSTPTQQMVLRKEIERTIGKDRKKREAKAGVSAEEQYSELKEARDWEEYVGSETAPVVAVLVAPRVAETGASQFGRALSIGLIGVAGQAKLKFVGDVRGVRLYRNGVEVEPLRGGHAPQKALVENQWVALKDVADMGYYVYPPEAFAPDSAGAPPRVTIVVQDLKNPGSLSRVDIEGATSARVWNDFLPFFATQPGPTPRAADPKRKSPKVDMDCMPETGVCTWK